MGTSEACRATQALGFYHQPQIPHSWSKMENGQHPKIANLFVKEQKF